MGGAIIRSLISAHFSISAYFLTIQTYIYKHMRLITQIYGTVATKKNSDGSILFHPVQTEVKQAFYTLSKWKRDGAEEDSH